MTKDKALDLIIVGYKEKGRLIEAMKELTGQPEEECEDLAEMVDEGPVYVQMDERNRAVERPVVTWLGERGVEAIDRKSQSIDAALLSLWRAIPFAARYTLPRAASRMGRWVRETTGVKTPAEEEVLEAYYQDLRAMIVRGVGGEKVIKTASLIRASLRTGQARQVLEMVASSEETEKEDYSRYAEEVLTHLEEQLRGPSRR